ncbi:MAG: InlB B-repeat-containing protein [Raoultibacter sp.]
MSRFQTSSTTKLMPSKKLLAVFLSATLVLSGISTSAYGAASETAEEKVLPDNPELVLDANETDAYHVVANDEFDTTALAAEPQKLDTPTSEIETPSATPEFESDVDVIADVSNPAFEGYSSVDSVLVKVTAAEGVLPEGTTVNATSVNRDDVIEAVAQRINEQGEQLQDATAIDVTLRDKDGNDIQPDGEVNVCFFNTNVTGDEIGIFRVSDDASLVETVKARQTDTTMQSFDVDHFTIYVVGGSVINSNADGGANSISNPYRMLTNSTMLLTSSPWKTPSSSWSIVEGDAYIDLTQESPDSARIASADEAGTAVVCYEYPSGATTKTEYFYITVENASKVTVSYGMNKINFNDGTTQGTYDVTGTVPASQEVMAGETITLPEPDLLTCSNGVFVGWSTYYNANAASAPSYTNVVYPAGAEYTVPQSNVKLHAIWARTNVNAQFYIYSAEGVPTEPQSHPDAAYYGPIVIENALETAAFYTDSTKGVDDRLLNKPSDEEITQALSAKHKTYDPTTQYVLWYVIKNEGNWHVDGVLLNKSLVRLSYDANAPAGSWSNMPDGQQYASGDTAQVSSKTPSRNGYTFTGWNTEKKGTGTFYESNENFTITGDTTLYAQWIPEGNTVYHVQRYDVNSQLLIDDSSRFAPTKSSVWATEADKTIEGYNYEGDNYSDSSSTTIINGLVAPDGSLVLKLYFSKRSDLSYTVNYLEEGTNRVLHAPKPVDSNVFGSYVTETALPLNGYHVVGDSEITLSQMSLETSLPSTMPPTTMPPIRACCITTATRLPLARPPLLRA